VSKKGSRVDFVVTLNFRLFFNLGPLCFSLAQILEVIRQEGLRALKDKLGVVGMVKFIQMYSDVEGDYTAKREELLKAVTYEDVEEFLNETV